MALGKVEAQVISMPGKHGDFNYAALCVEVDGLQGPYVLTMALPVVGARALGAQADPMELYEGIAGSINRSHLNIDLKEQPVAV